jgi:hypothetical protein
VEAPRSSFKGRQQKYAKKPYRARNWAAYEAGLRSRGSLTVWLGVDEVTAGTIPGWNAPVRRNRKRGRQRKCSRLAIETALRIGAVYHLPLDPPFQGRWTTPGGTTLRKRAGPSGRRR